MGKKMMYWYCKYTNVTTARSRATTLRDTPYYCDNSWHSGTITDRMYTYESSLEEIDNNTHTARPESD
jgi:hypothetical protein